MESLIVVGASGLAREVFPVARAVGLDPIGILDDAAATLPRMIGGVLVVGTVDDAPFFPEDRLLVCVGSGLARERIVARLTELGVAMQRYAVVIDPSVRNPGDCPVGPGSILLAGVVITADAVVGGHVVAMPGATITHDCVVDDFATLAAGVSLGGGVRVGRAAYVGMNASVRQGVAVGEGATIGMGAVVLGDVPSNETWAGVPAAPLFHAALGRES